MSYYEGWPPYVPVAERRRKAAAQMAKRAKKGHPVCPVIIEGRAIATTSWGKAWCTNLEAYADYANRLPRGRTYARNGSVVDLQLRDGRMEAHVSGSSLYTTTITVKPVIAAHWKAICTDCAGSISSVVDLLQGRLADGVMPRLCRQGDGLFPTPKDLHFACSCPDDARMCKHVAAVLYGIGNRLDKQPDLLFTLRGVNPADLIASAGASLSTAAPTDSDRILADNDLGALFGLEMESGAAATATAGSAAAEPVAPKRRRSKKDDQPPKRVARVPSTTKPIPRRPAPTVIHPPAVAPPRGQGLYPRLYRLLRKYRILTKATAQVALKVNAGVLPPLFKQLVKEGHATVTGRTKEKVYHSV